MRNNRLQNTSMSRCIAIYRNTYSVMNNLKQLLEFDICGQERHNIVTIIIIQVTIISSSRDDFFRHIFNINLFISIIYIDLYHFLIQKNCARMNVPFK